MALWSPSKLRTGWDTFLDSPAVQLLGRVAVNGDDPLDDFDPREIACEGVTKVVHVAGKGPAVM